MSTTKRRNGRMPPDSMNGSGGDGEVHATGRHVATRAVGRRRKRRGGTRAVRRLRKSQAVDAIRTAAGRLEATELRRSAASIARSIERDEKTLGIADTGGPLEAFIQAVDACDDPREAAAGAEAAVWALAWITRSRRSAGSAGALLERLVRRAERALPDLAAGDTSSARFVLALGRLFRDIEACRGLADDASAAVEREVVSVAACGGAVHRAGGAAIVAAVSEWAAFRATADATGGPAWSERCEDAFVSSLETAVRLLDASGRAVVAAPDAPAPDAVAIIDAARRIGGKPLASTAKRMARRESPASGLPRDVRHADERLAILRSGWRRRDARILVDARGPAMHLEIAVGDRLLFDGAWEVAVRVGGAAVEPAGPWEDSCFESDDDATFLEWTLPLARGFRLERQIVLAPKDRVLLLADSVVPGAEEHRAAHAEHPAVASTVDYRGTLPTAGSVSLDRVDETREMVGYDTSVRFLAVPLALPEWSSAAADGRFEPTAGRLVLEQRSSVVRLHAPVWIDLEPARVGEPMTWRQLTVADTRQNLPAHRACGYRVQAGTKQWLVYRALDAVRNRSVLGCNLACEFLLGRIGRAGMVERLIEIQ